MCWSSKNDLFFYIFIYYLLFYLFYFIIYLFFVGNFVLFGLHKFFFLCSTFRLDEHFA